MVTFIVRRPSFEEKLIIYFFDSPFLDSEDPGFEHEIYKCTATLTFILGDDHTDKTIQKVVSVCRDVHVIVPYQSKREYKDCEVLVLDPVSFIFKWVWDLSLDNRWKLLALVKSGPWRTDTVGPYYRAIRKSIETICVECSKETIEKMLNTPLDTIAKNGMRQLKEIKPVVDSVLSTSKLINTEYGTMLVGTGPESCVKEIVETMRDECLHFSIPTACYIRIVPKETGAVHNFTFIGENGLKICRELGGDGNILTSEVQLDHKDEKLGMWLKKLSTGVESLKFVYEPETII